jgi:hypothetical protein
VRYLLVLSAFVLSGYAPAVYGQSAELPAVAGIYGNTGLWKVLTADTLPRGDFSFSTWFDRTNRNPGWLTVSTSGLSGAVGITDRLEAGVYFEANQHVRVGQADQLSFGQQALGFFGNQTPGSAPLTTELMPGSSRVPQLRSPATAAGTLTGAAGYYPLLPFAGLVPSGSAVGLISLGVKYKILSESSGAPLDIAIHSHLDVPVHKAIDFLLTHPVGTADLQFGFDAIVSRNIGEAAGLYWNMGYRHIDQPAHSSVYHLSEEAPLSFGLTVPRRTRVQFVGESTAELFFGSHTPDTTFGAADPVDLSVGLRASIGRLSTFSAGYRRTLNQSGGDKDGFVIVLARNKAF